MRSAIAAYVISATIALLPIYKKISSVDLNRSSKDNLLLIIMGLLCAILGSPKRQMSISGWALAIIALFLNTVNQWNPASVIVTFHSFYFAIALVFFIRLYECFDLKHTSILLNGMCAGALIQFLFVGVSAIGIDLDFQLMSLFYDGIISKGIAPGLTEARGSLGNTNILAGYLALTMVAFLRKKWVWVLPLPLIALIFSNAMMGIGSFFAGVCFFILRKFIKNVKVFYFLSIPPMFLAYFTGLNGLDSGRFEIWGKLIKIWDLKGFVFGNGPGWFSSRMIVYGNTLVSQEHNIYLSVISVFGMLGLVAVMWIFFLAVKRAKNDTVLSTALFVIFINGYGNFSLHQSTMVLSIISLLAICLIKEEQNEFNMERSIFTE